jgi:hypothetical protein
MSEWDLPAVPTGSPNTKIGRFLTPDRPVLYGIRVKQGPLLYEDYGGHSSGSERAVPPGEPLRVHDLRRTPRLGGLNAASIVQAPDGSTKKGCPGGPRAARSRARLEVDAPSEAPPASRP